MADPTTGVATLLAYPTAIASTDGEKVLYTCTGTGVLGAIVTGIRFTVPLGTNVQQVWYGIAKSGQAFSGSPPVFSGARWLLEAMDLQPVDPLTEELHIPLAPGDRIIAAVNGTGATVTVFGGVLK